MHNIALISANRHSRCTARLLIGELTTDQESNSPIIDRVCSVFESCRPPLALSWWLMLIRLDVVLVAASQEQLDIGKIPLCELEWFSQNSYNLVVQYHTMWEPSCVLRLLNSCVKVRLT